MSNSYALAFFRVRYMGSNDKMLIIRLKELIMFNIIEVAAGMYIVLNTIYFIKGFAKGASYVIKRHKQRKLAAEIVNRIDEKLAEKHKTNNAKQTSNNDTLNK